MKTSVAILFVLLTIGRAYSQERIKVDLIVRADRELQTYLESYIERELRSLGDVDVTDENYSFLIHVVAESTYTVGHVLVGYALAVYIVNTATQDYSLEVRTGPPERLRSTCENLIIEFDRDSLQPTRKKRQQ